MKQVLQPGRFLVIGLLFFFQNSWADSPYIVKVQHYSLAEGLPKRGVSIIGQDSQGFIWIGTLSNAYRFDSYTFKALPYKKEILSNPYDQYLSVQSIQTDSEGNLWVQKLGMGTQNHFAILPPGESEFSSFQQLFKRPLPFDSYSSISLRYHSRSSPQYNNPLLLYTLDGYIWVYRGKGKFDRLYRHSNKGLPTSSLFTPTGTLLLVYPLPGNPHQNELIELTGKGRIHRRQLIPAFLSIVSVDKQGYIFLSHSFSYNETPRALPKLSPNQVDGFLYRLSPTNSLQNVPITWSTSPFPNRADYSFAQTKIYYDATHDLFWMLGPNVLFAWHPAKGIVFDLASTDFPVSSLMEIRHLFVDKTGGVWVSTDNGFLLLTLERNQFQRLLYSADKMGTPFKSSSRGLIKKDHWLWANSFAGSYLIDLTTKRARKLSSHQYIPAIRGHDNTIWTTTGDSLIQIKPENKVLNQYHVNKPYLNCWALWQDGRRNFWIGYDEGITYFDIQKQQNQSFTRYNRYPELAKNRIHGFFPDPEAGGLWVAASTGLYLLDTLRGITARYSTQDSPPYYLPYDQITFIHPDRQQGGIYWLSTRGGGLIRWERATGNWQQFTQQQGLSNDDLYSVHEDRRGYLWLPSNYGLMRFHKQSHQVQLFLPKDGITHEEFNLTSNFQSDDGQLFLGGLNGITAFYPDSILSEKPTVVPLVVTQVEQLNAKTGEQTNYFPEFDQTKHIVLPPENRTFSLAFALLDYRYGQQYRLSYRIVGWQDYWTSQVHRDISINGLPPGTYQLQVRAQNPNGELVSETLTIPITVLKPFYLQTWFFVLVALSLISVIIGFFQWRNHRLQLETKRLEAEVARRTAQIASDKAVIEQQAADLQANATLKARFFANVSHEFRTPLTLLLGPVSYLSKHLSDPVMTRLVASMDRNARQLLTMVSDLLDLSKLDENATQLVKQPADLAQLINQTVAMFHSQADYTSITLTAEGTSEPRWLLLDAAKVETVLKNLLANALRFTPSGGNVTIRLHFPTDEVQVDVTDTGTGIHPNDLPYIFERYYQSKQPDAPLRGGTGIGLALAHDYCTLWGGTLTVKSEPGKGSTFSFTHPYQPVTPEAEVAECGLATPDKQALPQQPAMAAKPIAPRILLVEDNADMVIYLETILTPIYHPHITRNGREAWEWLNSQPSQELPQLIVTDLMMPDMDGLALVDQIRQQPTLRTIPVLMLTARTSLDVKLEALRLGVADYVTKPFDQDELITRINNLLERSQERLAWQQTSEEGGSQPVSQDEEWLVQVQQLILKNLTNSTFQVGSLAEAINSSERQLYRRLKKATGFSPNQFMQEIRLQTAREWLEIQRYATVKEVCYAVGFQDVVYFSRLFLQRFGRYPISYLRTTEVPSATEE